jgi:surface antigen
MTSGASLPQSATLRAQHDPSTTELTKQEVDEIQGAIVKKNAAQLRYFGARRLSRYLLTLVDPPAGSSTGKSSPGDSSPIT